MNWNKIQKIGQNAELQVKKRLELLDLSTYKVLNDVLLGNDFGSAQIDHIVVSRAGVFIIETKNTEYDVFGDINEISWYRIINEQKVNFYNPVKQNQSHINYVKYFANNYDTKYHSVIVFVGPGKVSVYGVCKDTCGIVISLEELLDRIYDETEKVMTYKDMMDIYKRLKQGNIMSRVNLKKHINNLKDG